MPVINAEILRDYLKQVMPWVLAPAPEPSAQPEEAQPAKGKHAKPKPDFLTTNDTVVLPEYLVDVAAYMRDAVGYTYLSDIVVVDYMEDGLFELVYRFYHLEGGGDLVVKVRVPRDAPEVPSITYFWPGANLHEREGYDLFGINFVGHPDLRRLYMWEEFEGHPMRKDFLRQGDKYIPE